MNHRFGKARTIYFGVALIAASTILPIQRQADAGTDDKSHGADRILSEELSILDALDTYIFEARQAQAARIRTAAQLESAKTRLGRATDELAESTAKYEQAKGRLAATLTIARVAGVNGIFESLFLGDGNLESARRQALIRRLATRQAGELSEVVDSWEKAIAVEFVAGMERAQSWVLAKSSEDSARRLEEETAARRLLLTRLDGDRTLYMRRSAEMSEAGKDLVKTINARLSADSGPVDFERMKKEIKIPLAGGLLLVPFGDVIHKKFKTVTPHPGWTLGYPSKGPRNVRNIAFGRVVWTGRMRGFGTTIVVDHASGWYSVYGGVSTMMTKEGAIVRSGDIIAEVEAPPGDDMVTMYFELRKGGQAIDPAQYITLEPGQIRIQP